MARPLRSRLPPALTALLLTAAASMPAAIAGPGVPPQARVIVKLKPEAGAANAPGAGRLAERLDRAMARHGVQAQRPLGGEARLMTATGMDSATLARRLAADPEVAYAEPDRRMRRAAVPSDPLYGANPAADPAAGQWYLRPPDSLFVSAIDAQTAWDTSRSSSAVIVAVLDTGVRFEHPDLAGKLLAGYDFVRDVDTAGDGDGRDADPSDPGDFVSQADLDGRLGDRFDDCSVTGSSWHGTNVAGMIGALTDNAAGIAGAGWEARVLPVRVLGKCGGFQSDIVAAMRWAAGMHIDGVPDNPTPARILNLSLGGAGSCGAAYAEAIAEVKARGVSVVVAAGNSAGHRVGAPANCAGVIAVAALRHTGTKVGFSDLGPEVSISAPGGNCVNIQAGEPCLYPLVTTTDTGTNTPAGPAFTNGSNDITVGTSFSAPLVAGVAALMVASQPALTPDELLARLRVTARPFPTSGEAPNTPQCTAPRFTAGGQPVDQLECYCTDTTCGAGMLDARVAVLTALGVVARIALVGDDDPEADEPVTLDASGSLLTAGRTIASVQWTLVDGGGIVSAFDTPANQPTVTLTPRAAGNFTVSALVTDSAGGASAQSVQIAVERGDDGGGGGGALSAGYLLALLGAVIAVRRAVRGRGAPAR